MAQILVVDDDGAVRRVLRKHLETEGHQVCEAPNGDVALELMRTDPPDLLITDAYMPGMDGIEFTIRVRQQGINTNIVAISGGGFKDGAEVLERARSLGAVRALAKPFTRDELLEAVDAGLA